MAPLINPIYLKPGLLRHFAEGFNENNPKGIQLTTFMHPKSYSEFLKGIRTAKFEKVETRDMHLFFEAKPKVLQYFNSQEFLSFASAVSGRVLTKCESGLIIFTKGCFTLMHEKQEDCIEFYFDVTAQWNPEWGGNFTFLSDTGEKLIPPHAPNSLILADGLRSYVKYVNHLASKEGRLLVHGILK